MKWESHSYTACPETPTGELPVLGRKNAHSRLGSHFSRSILCVCFDATWCWRWSTSQKSTVTSPHATPPLMVFQCKEQNCHPFFRTPNQSLFCSLINLLASHQRRLYKFTPTLPPKSLQSPPPPCRVTIHFGCSDCHLTYILRVKSGCPGRSPQGLQWLHTALE